MPETAIVPGGENASAAPLSAGEEVERLRALARRLLAIQVPQGLLRNLDSFTAEDVRLIGELWAEGEQP